ncbi:type IV pilus assembly protein PilE [Paucimonas lemoignei]|uniref:Type IV pilus assembly protein PilE n=1 Tax=Paucimonas lemoignei TaxID=29443 RepID=A0A4R3HTX8_PAULE|nr:prepilin-type N-terminal cleavage/methylation domain-containing protein [Paucimonas lemoignei]TCS36478.1 type IV pilus assembly protein PilE [Paucimonas lemoignei]
MIKHKPIQSGFTLIELMVVVAIIGILAAIGYPNYTEHVRRSALQEAFSQMGDLKVKLTQFYDSNRNYGVATQSIPCGHDGTANRIQFSSSGGFDFSCELTGDPVLNQAFIIRATGTSGRANGHTYTLDSNNVKSTTKFKGIAVTANCWLDKKNTC